MTDARGLISYKHDITEEVRFISPEAYPRIPPGKSSKVLVAEAAHLVLGYIKEKILTNIKMLNKKFKDLDVTDNKKGNPDKNADANDDDETSDDLSKYQYDIETVEYLATLAPPVEKLKPKYAPTIVGAEDGADDPTTEAAEKKKPTAAAVEGDEEVDERVFMDDLAEAKKLDLERYLGPTLADFDVALMTVDDARKLVDQLALSEEKLERRLTWTREHLKV